MKVLLASLVLNEMEFLPKLLTQHRDWPGLVKWVFVEAADACYARANPTLVNGQGLSVDATTLYLAEAAAKDDRIVHIKHGLSRHTVSPAQGKCAARNRYLEVAEEIKPDVVIILDCDEFWPHNDQSKAVKAIDRFHGMTAFRFMQRQVWWPPCKQPNAFKRYPGLLAPDMFEFEVKGGFWDIPHVRAFRWRPGLRYLDNHNQPDPPRGSGQPPLDSRLLKAERDPGCGQLVHLGWAARPESRIAKNRYYVERGEGRTDHRAPYVAARRAWETWVPGKPLPGNARVVPYEGPVPEVFK